MCLVISQKKESGEKINKYKLKLKKKNCNTFSILLKLATLKIQRTKKTNNESKEGSVL